MLYLGQNKNVKANGVETAVEKNIDNDSKHPDVTIIVSGPDSEVDENEQPDTEVGESEKDPMVPVIKEDHSNNIEEHKKENGDSGKQGGLGDRESKLLEEMEKYLESNNVPP